MQVKSLQFLVVVSMSILVFTHLCPVCQSVNPTICLANQRRPFDLPDKGTGAQITEAQITEAQINVARDVWKEKQ